MAGPPLSLTWVVSCEILKTYFLTHGFKKNRHDEFRDLSVAVGKGPQFLKNFLDGGTTWNDNYDTADGQYSLETDAAIIDVLDASTARNVVFSTPDGGTSAHYPYYFSNFYNEDHECRLGAIECCYTASRKDATVDDNAEMCALDMSLAAQSNHIKSKSYTIFNTKSTDDTYCSGFAWEEGTFGDAVKYNTLFHMAMKENLYNKGRVKNIPGAPLCGCAEQMPIITNAACTRATEGYVIDSSGAVSVSIGWDDCDGKDLLDYYDNLPGRGDTEKFFMKSKIVGEGKCEEAIDNFMNDHMLIH